MLQHQISVSTVAFDGHGLDTAFASIADLGIQLVEPAYIKGYMQFTEDDFEVAAQRNMVQRLAAHGLSAVAISAHMDSGLPKAEAMLARRIRFAQAIGARFMITNSTSVQREGHLRGVIEASLKLAESCGVVIALENPGHGPNDLMRDAKRGATLVESFNSPWLRFNYDTANTLTCTEGEVLPELDIDDALPLACHVHLKDAVKLPDRWAFTAIGSGGINYAALMEKLRQRPDLPLTLELPLSLLRYTSRDPARNPVPLPLADINSAIMQSRDYVMRALNA